MRVCLVSDIHMEIGRYPQKSFSGKMSDLLGDGGDVLIVAGDLTCSRFFDPRRTDQEASDQRKLMDKFVQNWTTKFKRTYYVMGNHEHYGYILDQSSKVLGDYLKGTNVKILDPGYETFEDVLFVGGTFWVDFNKNDLETKYTIRYSMNDFRIIYSKHPDEVTFVERQNPDQNIRHGVVTPEYIIGKHERDKRFIEAQLNTHHDMKTVVITHHAPRMEFNGSHSTGLIHGYCTDQSALIAANPQIALWACGHTHYNTDFYQGGTRLVSNCRGYDGHESTADHFAPKFMEI